MSNKFFLIVYEDNEDEIFTDLANQTTKYLKTTDFEYVVYKSSDCSVDKFNSILKSNSSKTVISIVFAHGNLECISNSHNNPIINVDIDVHLFMYTFSCFFGAGAGKCLVENEKLESFWGYSDKVQFYNNQEAFVTFYLSGLKAYFEGNSLAEAREVMRQHIDHPNYPIEENTMLAQLFRHNAYEYLLIHGNKELTL